VTRTARSLLILPAILSWCVLAREGPVCAASPSDTAGHEPEVSVEVTITTPSRLDQPLDTTTGSVTLLSEPEMAAQQPVAVPEALRDLSGLDVREAGTLGEAASLRIRGAEPFQTLVLLDGVRINSPFRGDADLGDFLMDGITQIEVVRGGYSALYGSDAIGGAVNLRTLPPRRPTEVTFFTEGGTFHTAREGVSVGGKQEWGFYRIAVSRTDTDGQFEHDRFGATTLSGQLRVDVTPHSYVMITPRYQTDTKQMAITPLEFLPTFTVVSDDNNVIKRQFLSTAIEYRNAPAPWWEIVLKASTVQTDLDWDNPDTTSAVDIHNPAGSTTVLYHYFEETREREWTVNLQQNITWGQRQIFTLGLEQEWVDVHSKQDIFFTVTPPLDPAFSFNLSPVTDGHRRTRTIYAQQLSHLGDSLVLQAGLRADGDTQFGSTVNPKISTTYQFFSSGTTLRASWGTAYRAPTIQELDFVLYGNPALQPERAMSWEGGVRQSLMGKSLILDAAFFQIDFHNLIERFPAPAENVARARSRGIETELSWQPIAQAMVAVNYTWLDTEADGQAFPLSRRHRLNIIVTGSPFTGVVLRASAQLASGQQLPGPVELLNGTVEQGQDSGYLRIDVTATYELIHPVNAVRQVELFVKANNLLNDNYQDLPGFPAPGLNFLAGIRTTL
jgi:vitamin B12 transporter